MILIGVMVALLLGALYYFLRKRAPESAVKPDGTVTDYGTGGQTKAYGGIDFVTQQSTEDANAAIAGAKAYDVNDPNSMQRRTDALNRAAATEQLAATKGTTVEGLYQAHLAQQKAGSDAEFAVIRQRAAARGINDLTPANTYDIIKAGGDAGPPAGGQPPPGQYWDYATQSFQPLLA